MKIHIVVEEVNILDENGERLLDYSQDDIGFFIHKENAEKFILERKAETGLDYFIYERNTLDEIKDLSSNND